MAKKKDLFVAKTEDLPDGERKIVPNGNSEIGVYRVKGELYAYQNLCAHQGGPACEGLLMAKVEEVIAAAAFAASTSLMLLTRTCHQAFG